MDYDSNPEKGETAVAKLWPILTFPNYEKITLHFAALLLIGGSALADTFACTTRFAARAVTSPFRLNHRAEARRTVMEMFPGAVVTGVSRVKR